MKREDYINYRIAKFINNLFLVIIAINVLVQILLNLIWHSNIFGIILGNLVAVLIVVIFQKLWLKNIDQIKVKSIQYHDNKIDYSDYRKATINFKVIEWYVEISVAVWAIVIIATKFVKLNNLAILISSNLAFESTLLMAAFIMGSIYYSVKS